MHLGLRLLFGVFLILGLATFFVLRVFVNEIKPSVRDVLEEVMIDSANAFAELAAPELAAGTLASDTFAEAMKRYNAREPQAKVSGLVKRSVDYRVYVTDAQGIVRYDSENIAVGQDYSRWRDVLLTLRGEYGARVSRNAARDDGTSVFYVAAPIVYQGQRIGVLTLAKNSTTVGPFIERAENKILRSGAWLIGLSLLIGIAVTLWVVHSVRKLAHYAERVEAGQRIAPPELAGELGKLARAMNGMRERLEGKRYVENTIRALTHEVKSPLAAIRGAGELLQEPMNVHDQRRFAATIVEQSDRMQRTVERLLELSKLEGLDVPVKREEVDVVALAQALIAIIRSREARVNVRLSAERNVTIIADREQLQLALSNLIDNAIDFSPSDSDVVCEVSLTNDSVFIDVIDFGAGFADFAAEKMGERFVSSPRPDGSPKRSGLGLAIAKQIAELHGGALTLVSARAPTRIRISLPISSVR